MTTFPMLTGPLWAKSLIEARIRRAQQRAAITRMIKERLTLQQPCPATTNPNPNSR